MASLVVESARLTLRPFQESDVDPLFAIMGDEAAMQYTYTAPSRAACEQRLRLYARSEAAHGFAPWTVILRPEAKIVGWGGLNVDPFDPGWGPEISYCFHPAYWGQGYATEVVRSALYYGFELLSLPAIGAFASPQNLASIRVLEKCGFAFLRYEPRLERSHYEIQQMLVVP